MLRPRQEWQKLDFVLAAIALGFLAYAAWGAATAVAAQHEVDVIARACADGACDHRGVLAAHSYFGRGSRAAGNGIDYCLLTMDLDSGTRQVVVIGSICRQLSDGSRVDAEIWQGTIVAVTANGATFGTFQNPSAGIYLGLLRLLALVPFAFFVAMIHVDIANHQVVRKVWSLGRS